MSKTTIDGLTRRSTQTKRRMPAASNTSARRVVGGELVASKRRSANQTFSGRTSTTRRTMNDISRRPSRQVHMDDDFLSPVDSFGLANTDDLNDDNADWSDLLNQFEGQNLKNSDKKDSDYLLDDEELPEDPPKRQRSKKPKKHKLRPRRIVAIVIVLILVGAGGIFYFWGDSLISKLTGGNSGLWDTLWAMVSEEVPFETDEHGRTNVLVFGTEGYDMAGSSGDGVHDGAQLTDSIMIVSFDQETKDVALLSIPRDLKVSMACSAGKINEVYWCHNQDGSNDAVGAEALQKQLSQVLGIDIQYWAHVNWGSVVQIVDSIGGITVTLDEDIADYEYTGVVINAGVPTQLDGIQAVALARARHGTMGGDFTRGNSQQKIVEGIVNKLIYNGVGLTEALNLLNILGDNLRSNFSSDNFKAGVSLMSGFDVNSIRNISLVDYENNIYYVNTDTINGISYVVPSAGVNNYTQIHNYIDKMFSSNPAVREGADIAIYNATSVSGVAGAEQARLTAEGYSVGTIGDADSNDCMEKYCLYILNDEMAGTKAALESRYQTTARPAAELPTDIYPGYSDFIIVIGQAETE